MLAIAEPWADGLLRGTIYRFPNEGDVVPMHEHDERTNHLTFVLHGKIKVTGMGWSAEYSSGDLISFEVGQLHEISAAFATTVILNIVKGA